MVLDKICTIEILKCNGNSRHIYELRTFLLKNIYYSINDYVICTSYILVMQQKFIFTKKTHSKNLKKKPYELKINHIN